MTGRIAASAGLALLLGCVLASVFRPSLYPPYAEGTAYVAIANGDYSQVDSLYAGRVLHPLLARLVAHTYHTPIDARVFMWISVAALIAFFSLLGLNWALDCPSAQGLYLLLLVTPTLVDSYRNYYWHDLFYAVLCALFFLVLRASPWIGLPIVFSLYLTRESTIVLVAVLVGVAAFRRQWKFVLTLIVITFMAMKLVDSVFMERALPSKHGISLILMDFFRVAYGFFYNICGLEFWINTDAATLPSPVWTASIPAWLHLGNIREVGYCGFFWQNPARTLLIMSTAFGILPLWVIRIGTRGWSRLQPPPFETATAFVYGALMFLLAPLAGTWTARYALYSWPLFWLFGVRELRVAFPSLRKQIETVLLSLCTAWVPAVVRCISGATVSGPESLSTLTEKGLVISLVLVTGLYVWGWSLLKLARASNN